LLFVDSQPNPAAGFVRHIVTFHFKPNVSDEVQQEVMETYMSLQFKCVNQSTGELYILAFDGGFPNSKEGVDQRMQQGYIVTFGSVEDRNYFVGRPFQQDYDPYHDAFKAYVGPLLISPDGVFVFDFIVLPYAPYS